MNERKKSLKKEMRREFATILPNVLSAVVNTPVTPETVDKKEELIFKKVNFRMAFAALALVFFFTIAGGSGYTYRNPTTYLMIGFSSSGGAELSENMALTTDKPSAYLMTLGVNSLEYVVDYACSDRLVGEEINANVNLQNVPVKEALASLINYGTKRGYIAESSANSVQINVITNYDCEKYYDYIIAAVGNSAECISFYRQDKEPMGIYKEIVGAYPMMSPGRVCAIREILMRSDAYTLDELARYSNARLARILIALNSAKN